MEKQFKGKAIYTPPGAAGEYAKWACNFFKACSCACDYCYNRRWGWGNVPTLKKHFKDENHALEVFEKELMANLPELQKHGLFFSFSTDPCLDSTYKLTFRAIWRASMDNVKSKILTKMSGFADHIISVHKECSIFSLPNYWAFGFTLTGMDSLEPGASTNAERIEAMRKLHEAGFKTWASIEPVIDYESSLEMIKQTSQFCDLYKIGLQSGKKYDRIELRSFMEVIMIKLCRNNKIYFKDSLLKAVGIDRENNLSLTKNCIDSNYNMFNQ